MGCQEAPQLEQFWLYLHGIVTQAGVPHSVVKLKAMPVPQNLLEAVGSVPVDIKSVRNHSADAAIREDGEIAEHPELQVKPEPKEARKQEVERPERAAEAAQLTARQRARMADLSLLLDVILKTSSSRCFRLPDGNINSGRSVHICAVLRPPLHCCRRHIWDWLQAYHSRDIHVVFPSFLG